MSATRGARREVAVLLSRFPLITETFILREVIEMERQGQPVRLVPMIRESPSVIHPEARPWTERALFTPWISKAIAMANLRAFARGPLRYVGTLLELLTGMARSPDFLLRTIALFPKSVYLAAKLESEGIRHVHAHYATHPATMAMIIARFAPSITYSFTAHAHDIFVNRAMLAPKIERAAGVRVISRFNRTFLAALYPEMSPEKIEVIRVGIEPEMYRSAYDPDEPPVRILAVAALKPYKGISVLIDACGILAERGVDFICEIVGDGPLRKTLAAQVARSAANHRIWLRGALPQQEVAALVKRASLFVLPSVIAADHQMEGIPVALMEAMAAARPVIATAISGIPELVENGTTGILVDANNPEILAGAIQRAASDRALRVRLGEAGRSAVETDFDLETNVRTLIGWLDGMNPPADVGATTGERIGVRRVIATADSRVARAIVAANGGLPLDAVLKEHRSRQGESAPPEARAEREFAILRELHGRSGFDGRRLTVPQPIAREGAIVLMRPASGIRLDEAVKRARIGREGIERIATEIEGAAAWLRWFHGQAGVGGSETPLVHGDFWPGNVFVSDSEVTVIDFEGARPGAPLDDVAYFLVHLELFFPPPLRGRFRRLRARFLHRYFAGNVLPAEELARAESAAARALTRRLEAKGMRARLSRLVLAHHRRPEAA